MSDVEGVVTPEDIENEPKQKGKLFVVKKRRIINKLSKKINQIA